MKQLFVAVLLMTFFADSNSLFAQKRANEEIEVEGRPGKKSRKEKETQEIIIKSKGDKDMKLKVEIDGDNVTINGKPMSEFKDKNVTINKRKMIITDGGNVMSFGLGDGDNDMFNWGDDNKGSAKAFLGVTTNGADGEGASTLKGATITNVTKESAAEKAGLKEADIITKINSQEVNGPEALSKVIGSFKPKEEVTVYYTRDGKEKKATVTLGERKESSVRNYSFRKGPEGEVRSFTMPNFEMNADGMEGLRKLQELGSLNNDIFMQGDFNGLDFSPKKKKLGLKIQDTEDGGNVKIIAVEDSSAAALAGLQKDDLITEIDGQKIDNTDQAREQLVPEEGKKVYKMKVLRNKQELNIDVKIPRKLKTANL